MKHVAMLGIVMITMSSLKLAKIVNEKEQYGRAHPKC
jgi:hypothetical protein